MFRRKFLRGLSLVGMGSIINNERSFAQNQELKLTNERELWVDMLTKITLPVIEALSKDQLKQSMPVEAAANSLEGRKKVTYLESFGRCLAGLAPWLELGPDETKEGKLRRKFIELIPSAFKNAVSTSSKDLMNFTEGGQPLVDAAFLSHALLRAPNQLWGNLDKEVKQDVLNALTKTRLIKPGYNNWLLFMAMIEAALLKFTKNYDAVRVDYALKQHEAWYKGDGMYGDGPEYHYDYYNSFVIHPMLLDIVKTINNETNTLKDILERVDKRAKRYAEIQERMISPEGTFPPVGRSIAYRCGAFQLLSQMALNKELPESLSPSQVRSALTAVIKRSMNAPGTFDEKGWLKIGFCGHQPEIGETYISTGSLYLCSTAFLPLGLPPNDEFWEGPTQDWTSKKAYSGKAFLIDKALY